MDDKFRDLLQAACERPVMFVGRTSLWDLSHYFAGYCHCASDAGIVVNFGERFQRWVESRFAIFSSGWNWVRILQHEFGDDRSAIAALPALYDEFRRATDSMTNEEVWNMMERSLIKMRGDRHWCPDDTDTWTSPLSQT